MFLFDMIHQCLIDHPETSGRRIISGKIPISGVSRTAFAQIRAALEDHLDLGVHPFRRQSPGDRRGQLVVVDAVVYGFETVGARSAARELRLGACVALEEEFRLAAFFEDVDRDGYSGPRFRLAEDAANLA